MRRRGYADRNQGDIVAIAKAAGAWVIPMHEVGDDAPDLLVGWEGSNLLVEVKNPESKGKLSPGQVKWHEGWPGDPPLVVETQEEMLMHLGIIGPEAEALIDRTNKNRGKKSLHRRG